MINFLILVSGEQGDCIQFLLVRKSGMHSLDEYVDISIAGPLSTLFPRPFPFIRPSPFIKQDHYSCDDHLVPRKYCM